MANRYLVGPSWMLPDSWSTIPGGQGGASVPTKDDDVFIGSSSPSCSVGFIDWPLTFDCRNLTINSYSGTLTLVNAIHYAGNVGGHNPNSIKIYGEFNANSGTIIGESSNRHKFTLLGTLGTVENVSVTRLDSSSGRRIYNIGGSISNSPFWRDSIPTLRHITNLSDLQGVNDNPDDDYILDNDIDLNGESFTPLGLISDPFTGQFDGNGKTIKNLSIDDSMAILGLFERISNDALITNLNLENITFSSASVMGGLVGYANGGSINNCHLKNILLDGDSLFNSGGLIGEAASPIGFPINISDCSVEGLVINDVDSFVGGIVGYASMGGTTKSDVIIEKCHVNGMVMNCKTNSGVFVGGFIGGADGIIKECSVQCVINGNDVSVLGGFAGNLQTEGFVENCSADVAILINGDGDFVDNVGGFVGESSKFNFNRCFCVGKIECENSNFSEIGGFIGVLNTQEDNFIQNCYSQVNIILKEVGEGSCENVGGFIGTLSGGFSGFIPGDGGIKNSYSSGDIRCDVDGSINVGGFIGSIYNSENLELFNVFSAGLVDVSGLVGGFIGLIDGDSPNIENCSWWTGANNVAIGDDDGDGSISSLQIADFGTDEPDNTKFMNTTNHPVFAQGT